MFFVKKNIVDEHVNTWCKLAGAMTEMSDNQKTIALTASYDDQYAVSANTAHNIIRASELLFADHDASPAACLSGKSREPRPLIA